MGEGEGADGICLFHDEFYPGDACVSGFFVLKRLGGVYPLNHTDFMQLAVQIAKAGKGQTSPNPMVGAVVVKGGEVVGLGAHLKAGDPHAEVHALKMAGARSQGATIYITLEPCSHHGKTPPCADLIVQKGIQNAFVAGFDPNPKVAGRGIEKLRNAGIEVTTGLLKQEADELNEVFYHYIQTKTPFVTLKQAASLDGKTATVTGESKWITGEQARVDVHHYRHRHDAILVGVGTILADNPSLTTRLPGGGNNPVRVVLDHHLRTPLDAKVITGKEANTWIITAENGSEAKEKALQQAGAKVIRMPSGNIMVRSLLQVLGENGITSVFVEGGATVTGSFLLERAFNRVITYIAPKLLGGNTAPSTIGGTGFDKLSEAPNLDIISVERLGQDLKIISRLEEEV